jgi:hypothetical protein
MVSSGLVTLLPRSNPRQFVDAGKNSTFEDEDEDEDD